MGIGTSIVTRAGPIAELVKIERKDAPATVYNFEVEDFHTYFVGDAGLWVHNDCLLQGFNEAEAVMINQSFADLADAGYDVSAFQILIKEWLPPGLRGMALSEPPTGAALSSEAFFSQAMLNHVMEEELRHLGQDLRGRTFGPGTADELEGEVDEGRIFPEP